MKWNWQQVKWPQFQWQGEKLVHLEGQFLHQSGILAGCVKHFSSGQKRSLTIEIFTSEALKTSEIEGEFLNRLSVQSSIQRHFGLNNKEHCPPAEQGIADMMVDLYQGFDQTLTHQVLFRWHQMLLGDRRDLQAIGQYRNHPEPMQVISGSLHKPKVHFQAPPSEKVQDEMKAFMQWFASSGPNGKEPLGMLTRAAITHLYFVCIHPFEDGNGRIGRAIVEKSLSENLGRPSLIALSQIIKKDRKKYYHLLESNNKQLEITDWVIYFAQTILDAQAASQLMIEFVLEKTKLLDRIKGQLNDRQEKAIHRMFEEGVDGFKGGLSVANYIQITKTSRATATRDLQHLVKIKALKRTGQLKGTRYQLNIQYSKPDPEHR